MHLGRRLYLLAAAPVIAMAVPGSLWLLGGDRAPASAPSLRLSADLSDRRLKMFNADTLVWQYPIAIGAPGYPTPPGTYTIRRLTWNPRWVPPPHAKWARKYTAQAPGAPANPMKVVKIFFRYPDYYIHGTHDIASLGNAASHGCLRMDPEHVAEVARYLMEHGGEPRPENWFWRILHFRNEEKTIYLKRPITLTVTG
jgi:hypothetical protein